MEPNRNYRELIMLKSWFRLPVLLFAFFCVAWLSQPTAHAQQAAQPSQAVQAADSAAVSLADGYVLGPGDVLEVSVLGREEYKPRVQVQVDGTIQLPYINNIVAADKTVLQLREDIRRALTSGGYFNAPAVNITVVSYASRYVTVLGEVANPGIVPVDKAYRVSEIIARVGGLKDSGSDTIALRRETGEDIKLSLQSIATGDSSGDPIVNPGDKIFVPKAETFYIYGQVTAPGTYRVDQDMTLRMALARGGGLTSLGSEKKVKVFRNGERISGFKPEDRITGGDVVVVGERFF